MKICQDCTEHRMMYELITTKEKCECGCHAERETGCATDPCCR